MKSWVVAMLALVPSTALAIEGRPVYLEDPLGDEGFRRDYGTKCLQRKPKPCWRPDGTSCEKCDPIPAQRPEHTCEDVER